MGEVLELFLSEIPLDPNSLVFWRPRVEPVVRGLGAPSPRTVVSFLPGWARLEHVALAADCRDEWFDDSICRGTLRLAEEAAERLGRAVEDAGLGYPFFLRTDQKSYKGKTHVLNPGDPVYRVSSPRDLSVKVERILLYASEDMFTNIVNGLVERAPRALVAREWIEPEVWIEFREPVLAGMPYSRVEARAIVRNGRLTELFPYYHIAALAQAYHGEVKDWDYIIEAYRENYAARIISAAGELRELAEAIGGEIGGSWSIDFMLGRDGKWYLIDMALEKYSWKPPRYEELEPEARRILDRLGGGAREAGGSG